MTIPQERLARMRKSFGRNRSVLAEDYKYFTTPDAMPRVSTPPNKAVRKSEGLSVPKSPKRS